MKLLPLDILFSEYIRKRAIARIGGCERCLTTKIDILKDNGKVFTDYKQLQCSHFIGRSRRSVRWDEDNAVGLCAACHLYFTANPIEYVQWFMNHIGEEKLNLLMARNRNREKPDIEAITLYLKAKMQGVE